MKATIVFAQPGDKSFTHEMLARTKAALDKAGISYNVRDLYKMNFQPVLSPSDMEKVENGSVSSDIGEEQELLTDADLLVMIYPIWWWSQPAILKGYFDRVLTNGYAFRYEANGPVGLMNGKQAIVFTCTRESEAEMKADGFDTLIKKQIVDGVLSFIGCDRVVHKNFAAISEVSDQKRSEMLREVEETVARFVAPVPV
ncbi:MAG TPA: NAD(P)H-dependent oxidoreductase [Candidatus Bathyarchaeia archaeon]|nr:NAD(P)H-dependent oxidoreductase [Candidatus Bathyarchaeia archaeon]